MLGAEGWSDMTRIKKVGHGAKTTHYACMCVGEVCYEETFRLLRRQWRRERRTACGGRYVATLGDLQHSPQCESRQSCRSKHCKGKMTGGAGKKLRLDLKA